MQNAFTKSLPFSVASNFSQFTCEKCECEAMSSYLWKLTFIARTHTHTHMQRQLYRQPFICLCLYHVSYHQSNNSIPYHKDEDQNRELERKWKENTHTTRDIYTAFQAVLMKYTSIQCVMCSSHSRLAHKNAALSDWNVWLTSLNRPDRYDPAESTRTESILT